MSTQKSDTGDTFNDHLAAAFRAERAAQNLTYEELEYRSGVAKRTLIRLLNGERVIKADQMIAIADAYEIPLSDLIAQAERRMNATERGKVVHLPHISDGMTDQEALDQMGANPLQHAADTHKYDSEREEGR